MENETQISSPKKRFPWKGFGVLMSAFAVIVILYVMHAVYFSFITLQKMQQAQSRAFQRDIALLKIKTDFLQKFSNETQQNQAQQMQAVREAIQKFETGSEAQFAIENADFLVNYANQTLTLDHNVLGAINVLKKADQTLQGMNNAKAIAAREALAKDIANLQSIPIIDVTGIYMRLNALNETLQRLPLITKLPDAKDNAVTSTQNENLSWWKKGLQNTWKSLRDLVVIRYNTKERMPLISPDQETFLYGLLTSEVMHAEWGLLHSNNNIYQTSLSAIKKYVEEYFVSNAAPTLSVIRELRELAAINIQPQPKEISGSLQSVAALKKGD